MTMFSKVTLAALRFVAFVVNATRFVVEKALLLARVTMRYGCLVKVLLTGGTGVVGQCFAQRLLSQRPEVELRLVTREGSLRAPWMIKPSVTLIPADLQDPNQLMRAAEGVDVVVHAAARTDVNAPPEELEKTNVLGTENVIQAARHAGCKRLVHISCADVSLVPEDRVNWNEARKLTRRPLGHYAQSKLLSEEIALAYSNAHFEVVALRPAVLWGMSREVTLRPYKDEVRKGIVVHAKGNNWFSTTHIQHLIDAMQLSLDLSNRDVEGEAYYITDGEVYTSREFVEGLSNTFHLPKPRFRSLRPCTYPPYAQRIFSSWFDTLKARHELGFIPQLSIAEGLKRLKSSSVHT